MAINLKTGYAYVYEGQDWNNSSSEEWDTEVVSDKDELQYEGSRKIDGQRMYVWKMTDGRYAAQIRFV